ncbi:MAG: heme transporter HemC [Kordiimonas sp.]|nr:heme transporter HemC [Kordiimonas sp.]
MHKFANPARFIRLSDLLLPWLMAVTVILLTGGLYMVFFASPDDYQQGATVRIMYVHVPAAYMAMLGYSVMAVASASSLIWKHPLADQIARAAAPIGAAFTLIALITGSLWGRPMWGTWWVWDARLTSVLILLFLYLGYMALWEAIEDPIKAAKACAILALVGFVNVPIIKFSVDWWNTLHQPASLFKMGGSSIHPEMLWPLLLMIGAFKAYFFVILLWRVKTLLIGRKIRALRMAQLGDN